MFRKSLEATLYGWRGYKPSINKGFSFVSFEFVSSKALLPCFNSESGWPPADVDVGNGDSEVNHNHNHAASAIAAAAADDDDADDNDDEGDGGSGGASGGRSTRFRSGSTPAETLGVIIMNF